MTSATRNARQQRGWSLWQLAVRSRTSPAMLIAIEKHGHIPGPDLRQRIAGALGVPENTLWPDADRR